MNKKHSGFTLIELVIAVGIAAILARIGYVSYSSYIMRANRSLARVMLVSLSAKQETQALRNGGYATTFASLNGIADDHFYIDQNGTPSTNSAGSIYEISFAATPAATATAFVLQADAQGIQARRDTGCSTLTLSSTGIKAFSGATSSDSATCWDK